MTWDRTKGRPEPIRALNKIKHKENGEPLVPLGEHAPSVRIFKESAIPYCRLTVAQMAEEAAQKLPTGMYLSVTEAWRPIKRQRRIYEFMSECVKEVFPDISYAALRRRVNRWVAPVDQKAPPGHSTGAALDVYLVDENNEQFDVKSPLEGMRANPTYAFGLSPEAQRNRDILVEAMLGVGFSNCRDEWWHYSYGDAGWAVRLGYDTCFYDRIELDPELYRLQQQQWEERLRERENPFLKKA
jgi:D-alanyl-D-alanine dipeptidase